MKKNNNTGTKQSINIGMHMKEILQERNLDMLTFAEKIPCSISYAYKLLRKKYIDTDVLYKISEILEYNFFDLYGEKLNLNGNRNLKMNEKQMIHVHIDLAIPSKEFNRTPNKSLCDYCPYNGI